MTAHLPNFNIKNRQKTIAGRAWFFSFVFAVLMVLPFVENNPFTGAWAFSFISLFLLIVALVTALIFNSRAKKMKHLLNNEKLIAHWQMTKQQLDLYVEKNSEEQKQKRKALLWIISIFFALFTVIFLIILDDDDERLVFFLIMFSVYFVIVFSAFFFAWYYKKRNSNGDGTVLIGSKYIYINGFFHNWDFPISGLKRLRKIEKPFAGIDLLYYYTDRTWTNSYELLIPVPENIDRQKLIEQIWSENS